MPRKKSAATLSTKQMKRTKPINTELLKNIEPLTPNQEVLWDAYAQGSNVVAYGVAGTGKTFCILYNAMKEVLNEDTPYEKIYIVRSLVPTREIGFLPGTHEDKSWLYQVPYRNMVKHMFSMYTDKEFDSLYEDLQRQETISFWSTSFLRGTTLDNAIIIVDEFENLNFHELDSIITRVGENSKIFFAGDASQSDLQKVTERSGILDFMQILNGMPEFTKVEFTLEDIVRSGLVRSYLVSKINQGYNEKI
tara:strand:- start:2629 stop:3378 length:750 start_codon:yes stop_codon:yes gene_type:complete